MSRFNLAGDGAFIDWTLLLRLACPFGLSDFFVNLSNNPTPTPFTAISLPAVLQQYGAEWFEDFGLHQGDPAPSDPDDDVID